MNPSLAENSVGHSPLPFKTINGDLSTALGDGRQWLVMKFGGTCLGTKEGLADVVQIVRSVLDENYIPVIVCSAISPGSKADGTTSLLLRASIEALEDGAESAHSTVRQIEDIHCNLAQELGLGEQVIADMRAECTELVSFLSAVEVVDELSPRMKDTIVCKGERLSCLLIGSVLEAHNVRTETMYLDSVFNKNFLQENDQGELLDQVTMRLGNYVRNRTEPENKSVVVTGFVGSIPGSLLSRVGRGYSDLTAGLLAAGLNSPELIIWKQVDGILTADPGRCPNAQVLPSITADEADELTFYGSEVVHQLTIKQVISKHQKPIRIVNAKCRDRSKGTIIEESGPGRRMVTTKGGVVIVHIKGDRRRHWTTQIFKVCESYNIAVDLVTTSVVQISLAIALPDLPTSTPASQHNGASYTLGKSANGFTRRKRLGSIEEQWFEFYQQDSSKDSDWVWIGNDDFKVMDDDNLPLNGAWVTKNLAGAIDAFKKLGQVTLSIRQVILSIVGRDMRGLVGTAAELFQTLAIEGVNIQMISQGASEINITTVIGKKDEERALRAVHDELVLTTNQK